MGAAMPAGSLSSTMHSGVFKTCGWPHLSDEIEALLDYSGSLAAWPLQII